VEWWLGSGVPTKAIEILESPGNHNVTIIDEKFWVDGKLMEPKDEGKN